MSFSSSTHSRFSSPAAVLSILYVGYILFQVPSNLLLAKVGRPRIYLPICTALWGIVSGLSAVVNNFEGLLVVRFFLGIVEAAFFPGESEKIRPHKGDSVASIQDQSHV